MAEPLNGRTSRLLFELRTLVLIVGKKVHSRVSLGQRRQNRHYATCEKVCSPAWCSHSKDGTWLIILSFTMCSPG